MVRPRPDPKMLDDLARVAGGAVNIFSGMQDQLRSDLRARMDDMANRLDLVPRDELDRAVGMIDKLRKQVQTLESRIEALEKGKKPAAALKAKKPAAKKAATKKKNK
jgi:BMFP domain-containing protein YqiC